MIECLPLNRAFDHCLGLIVVVQNIILTALGEGGVRIGNDGLKPQAITPPKGFLLMH